MHELEEESGKKKRKAGSGRALNAQAPEIAHASELSGHNDGVTSVIWSTPETITSGSMDHTVSCPCPAWLLSFFPSVWLAC